MESVKSQTVSRMEKRVYLSAPHMGGTEQSYIQKAFDSNWIAPLGENVDRFEDGLSSLCEGRPVVALSSGTAAIHLALIRLGVGAGDVVLTQSFTFCASANPIKYVGATPVFIGSESETWNISPEALESGIKSSIAKGKRPKAIIYVHLYGVPAKIAEITEIASRFDIPLIEDAAESLGSRYRDRPTGVFGDFGILSFNGNKIITTSGGGALVCNSKEDADKVRFLATQARDPAPYYLHSEIGFNYRLSNVLAGIGCGQLEVLEKRIEQRRDVYERYKKGFENSSEVVFLNSDSKCFENRWLTAVTFNPSRKTFDVFSLQKKLDALNIECRPLWNPLHRQPIFRECEYFGSEVEVDLFERGLCLPSSSFLSEEVQENVIRAVKVVGELL